MKGAGEAHRLPPFAFFDVDETLISIKSMMSFQEHWYAELGDEAGHRCFLARLAELARQGATREEMNRGYYASFRGRAVAAVAASAERWFESLEARRPALFRPAVVAALRRHQVAGTEAVLVSGSFPDLLAPIALRLGARHVLATRLAVRGGVYTGEIHPPQTIGAGKARAMAAFLLRHDADGRDCHAYGDDVSDIPMLDAVGHPTAIRGSSRLEAHAERLGWPLLSPD